MEPRARVSAFRLAASLLLAFCLCVIAAIPVACGKGGTAPAATPVPTVAEAPTPRATSGPCDRVTQYAAPGAFQCVNFGTHDPAPCSANPCPAGVSDNRFLKGAPMEDASVTEGPTGASEARETEQVAAAEAKKPWGERLEILRTKVTSAEPKSAEDVEAFKAEAEDLRVLAWSSHASPGENELLASVHDMIERIPTA
jgi:hypothetical protein